jgi:hypothetical protein
MIKSFLTIIIMLLAQVISAQATLKITLSNCKTDMADSSYSLNIYKDSSFFKSIQVIYRDGAYDTALYNLDIGTYTIENKSYFGDTLIDTVKIIKDTSYWTFICTDEIRDYSKAYTKLIDSLTRNKQLLIEFQSYGCFHWESQKLKIFKKADSYFATLYPEIKKRENKAAKGNIQTRQLSASHLKLLYEFQLMAYVHASGYSGGTEIVFCTFKYKSDVVKLVLGNDISTVKKLFRNFVKQVYGTKHTPKA